MVGNKAAGCLVGKTEGQETALTDAGTAGDGSKPVAMAVALGIADKAERVAAKAKAFRKEQIQLVRFAARSIFGLAPNSIRALRLVRHCNPWARTSRGVYFS